MEFLEAINFQLKELRDIPTDLQYLTTVIIFFFLHYLSAYQAEKETAKLTHDPQRYFPYIFHGRVKLTPPPEIRLYNLERI